MRKAAVIGSRGNVGGPLVRHLTATGWDVLESDIRPGWRDGYLQADINQPFDLLPILDFQPDVIFALAAMVSRVTCEQASSLAVTTNLTGLNNVVLLARRARAKLVYFSTSEVYGPDLSVMDEAGADPQPNNRYGLTKLLGEKLVEYDVRQHGLKAVTLRPFMIYDEDEDLGDHRSAMIRFAWNLATGEAIEVHRGSARGWLHASDAVRAVERAAALDDYTVVNIGSDEIVPIADLAERIRARLNAPRELVRETGLPGRMTLAKRPTLERMQTLLGVTPTVALDEGLDRVCARTVERARQAGKLAPYVDANASGTASRAAA